MDRRLFFSFLMSTFVSLPFFLKRDRFFKVCFKYNLKNNQITAEDFFRLRSSYEDDHKIAMLNKLFIKNGWILSHDYIVNDEEMQWVYAFKNQKLFHHWEQILYQKGFVKQEDRPYLIERKYEVIS